MGERRHGTVRTSEKWAVPVVTVWKGRVGRAALPKPSQISEKPRERSVIISFQLPSSYGSFVDPPLQ